MSSKEFLESFESGKPPRRSTGGRDAEITNKLFTGLVWPGPFQFTRVSLTHTDTQTHTHTNCLNC